MERGVSGYCAHLAVGNNHGLCLGCFDIGIGVACLHLRCLSLGDSLEADVRASGGLVEDTCAAREIHLSLHRGLE